jgi:hypothetical protein
VTGAFGGSGTRPAIRPRRPFANPPGWARRNEAVSGRRAPRPRRRLRARSSPVGVVPTGLTGSDRGPAAIVAAGIGAAGCLGAWPGGGPSAGRPRDWGGDNPRRRAGAPPRYPGTGRPLVEGGDDRERRAGTPPPGAKAGGGPEWPARQTVAGTSPVTRRMWTSPLAVRMRSASVAAGGDGAVPGHREFVAGGAASRAHVQPDAGAGGDADLDVAGRGAQPRLAAADHPHLDVAARGGGLHGTADAAHGDVAAGRVGRDVTDDVTGAQIPGGAVDPQAAAHPADGQVAAGRLQLGVAGHLLDHGVRGGQVDLGHRVPAGGPDVGRGALHGQRAVGGHLDGDGQLRHAAPVPPGGVGGLDVQRVALQRHLGRARGLGGRLRTVQRHDVHLDRYAVGGGDVHRAAGAPQRDGDGGGAVELLHDGLQP